MTAETIEEMRMALHATLPEALHWLKRMVSVNSFTTNPDGVNRNGKLLAECLAPLGFTPEFVNPENPEYGQHGFYSRGDKTKAPVVLVTHLDTVFPEEEELRNHFCWREAPHEGRIYGPGTVDIKGGTVLIWMMLQALKETAGDLFEQTHWLVAANASEERIGADFGRRVAERCPNGARSVLVFEGGPRENGIFHLVTERKGRALYRLSAEGRGSHAGSSHASGVNAIVALSGAIPAAAEVTDYSRDVTVNVGWITGGTVVNRVPEEAAAELEIRAFHPEVLEEACRRIEAIESLPTTPKDARIRVSCMGNSPSWPETNPTRHQVSFWEKAAALLGEKVKTVSRGGLSDANYLCHLGPTLDGLGPVGANAHCSERSEDGSKVPEYVEPGSFVPKALLNTVAIRLLLAES